MSLVMVFLSCKDDVGPDPDRSAWTITGEAKIFERSRRSVKVKFRLGLVPEDVAFVRKTPMGPSVADATEAHQAPTLGSRNARRQMSMRGKSDVMGRRVVSVVVSLRKDARRAGVALGSFGLAPLAAPATPFGAGGAANRDLRYGRMDRRRVALMSSRDWVCCSWGEAGTRGCLRDASSMKEYSLFSAVSRAGIWVKRIGARERDFVAGRERDVCGWAVDECSFSPVHG